MAVNIGNIAEKIMKFVRGNGLQMEMFDQSTGKTVADPTQARLFYVDSPNMMITIDEDSSTLSVHIGEGLSINEPVIKKLRNNLRSMARDNLLDFDIRSFGDRIAPKNYQFKVEKVKNKENDVADVFEGISPLEGSTRTSRQHVESAKIIVKHKKPVNEESRGARARNISAIFIENAEGERFKYPYKHLSGARAMARHIASGGMPTDVTGSAIVEMSDNLFKLKEFMNIVDKQKLVNENNRDVVLNVKRSMKNIKEDIARIQTVKGYAKFVESLALNEDTEEEISEDTINSYVSKFTKTTFEESLKDILPLVHKVNEKEFNSVRNELAEKVMSIITAKNESGGKINNVSIAERNSTLDQIKQKVEETELSESDEIRELAKYVEVVAEDDSHRGTRGTDRAAVISMFLNDVAESLEKGKELTETQKMLTSYFKKRKEYSKGVDGVNATESKSLEEKFDEMINESFESNFRALTEYK